MSMRTLAWFGRTAILSLVLAGLGLSSAEGASKSFRFDSARSVSEWKIPLSDLGSGLPSDWSGYEALVLKLRASSPQRMSLKIYVKSEDPANPKFSRVLFHPYPKVTLRAAIPIAMLAAPPGTGHDMAAVGNRSRLGYFLSLWGPFHPLTEVVAVGFEMENPIGSPTLELESAEVARVSPGDAVLDGLPVVDQFGQSRHDDWPGKASDLAQLEKAWRDEEKSLQAVDFGYCGYGGYKETRARATGYFRVEQIDGKWWFVDPDGHLFLSAGSDVIMPGMSTPRTGRESLFAELPPADTVGMRARSGDPGVSFFAWNLLRRFGDGWKEKWIDLTVRRMQAWGLNTIANWSDPELYRAARLPYAIPLAGWSTRIDYLGLPDVYSQEFAETADRRAAEQCAARKDDPWLLGYFLANEPPFPQKEIQTTDLILAGPETATKKELQQRLSGGDTPEKRKAFIADAFSRYIEIASAAVRKYDPNHLNLGMRSGGRPTEAEIRGSRAFDVYSVNIYDREVSPERARDISRLTGKPILIGEFHFGTPGRGMAASLVQVRDQKERGVAYRYYVEQAFALPEMIGTHWFQWADQPCTGRSDGENYNIGLVDVTDRPYGEMIESLKVTHRNLLSVHQGRTRPFATPAAPK